MNDETDTMVEEQDLVAAMRHRRPPADAFTAKVRARLDARLQQQPEHATTRSRAAAVALPVGTLPYPDGFTVVKVLSLPVVTLGAAVLAFFAGLRSAKSAAAAPAPAWRANLLHHTLLAGPLLALATPWFLGASAATDVLMALLVAAMSLFALQLRHTAMAPADVARVGAGILATAYGACFLWDGLFDTTAADSAIGHGLSGMALVAGLLAASVFEHRLGGATLRTRLAVVFTAGWIVLALATRGPLGASTTSADALAEDVATFHADPTRLSGWTEIAAVVEALDAIGAPRPDLTRIDASVARAVSDATLDVHPAVWTAAARMGVVDAAEWRALAGRQEMAVLVDGLAQMQSATPLRMPDYDEFEFWMLRGAQPVSTELADHLVRRIEAAWPAPATFGELQDMALRARLLEVIGRADRIAAHRDEIHAALLRQWIEQARGLGRRTGGFAADRRTSATSSESPTWAAVALMARVGAPAGVDLRVVRSYLRARSHSPVPGYESPSHQLARATTARLEVEIGLPERAWWLRVVDERVLIGSSLLALLCMLAIGVAIRSEARRAGIRG